MYRPAVQASVRSRERAYEPIICHTLLSKIGVGPDKERGAQASLRGDGNWMRNEMRLAGATKQFNDRLAWLKGGGARCAVAPQKPVRPYRLVLLGAPGVGKGTQAELLSERLGACPLSTGDVFRAAKTLDPWDLSPSMGAALEYMRKGELVPDETVLDLVRERSKCLRCRGGFLLDGFPRTVAQAEALEELLRHENRRLDAVLSYELPLETIVSRLSGRRTCPNCKAVFHVQTRPPRTEDVCDQCGGHLAQREDDQPEAVRVRMKAYEKSTAPLQDFYRRRGLLRSISAEGAPEEICRRAIQVLQEPPIASEAAG